VKLPPDTDALARILAKTCEYLDIPAVVGREAAFLDHVARDFRALSCEVERTEHLTVIETGRPGPVFIAHGDRHGAVSDGAGGFIYAAHAFENEHLPQGWRVDETFTAQLAERHAGDDVFAYDPVSGGRIAYGQVGGAALNERGHAALLVKDMLDLPEGAPLAFARSLERNQRGFIAGQIDNALTIAALRVGTEFGLGGRIIITSEALIGRSARYFLDWAQGGGLAPTQDLVVCDTSPFDDAAASLAGTVTLRRRDASASFHADQVSRLERAATSVGAPIIFKDSFIERENDARTRRGCAPKPMGFTELGWITAQSKGAYAGATLQLPTFDQRTSCESTTPRAVTAFARTLMALNP
jgi:hypothetical protein